MNLIQSKKQDLLSFIQKEEDAKKKTSISKAKLKLNKVKSDLDDLEEESSERLIPIVVEASTEPCDMLSGAATASEIFRHLQVYNHNIQRTEE